MYKGDIPFHRNTGQPMYYPQDFYEWKYKDKIYDSWMKIEQMFGRKAVDDAERIAIGPDWKPNGTFEAQMTLEGFSRGRSAANFDVMDEQGLKYTIFMTDFAKLLQEHGVVKGQIENLTWQFCKRGQNYGIQHV